MLPGETPADGLLVQLLEEADPAADLAQWAEAPVRLTGVPLVSAALAGYTPVELLEWRAVPGADTLASALEADEARLYEALTRIASTDAPLARVYVVLARRGRTAWHVELSLATACPPGTPESVVAANDHARAAAVLGALRLGQPRP